VRATHLEAAGHHTAQMVRNVKHDTPEVVDKGSCSSEGVTEGCNAGLATAICPYIHRCGRAADQRSFAHATRVCVQP